MSAAETAAPTWALQCRGLTKRYERRAAVEGVDLAIAPGERVAVFGRNGAGKTTLIKLLAGLLRPSGGWVRVWGQRPWGREGVVRAQVGLATHQSYLYEELSAQQNLLFYGRLYGVRDPAARVASVLEQFGLAYRARDPVRTLSRGLQQRVALARAVLHRPSVLLLDEPDTGLDPSARASLSEVLLGGDQGLTVVLATHNLEMGMTLCSRSVILKDGRLAYDSRSDGEKGAGDTAVLRSLLDSGS